MEELVSLSPVIVPLFLYIIPALNWKGNFSVNFVKEHGEKRFQKYPEPRRQVIFSGKKATQAFVGC